MNRAPLLSVVVPAFGVENWIGDCLSSVIHQPLRDLEVVVVNDATHDRSAAVAREFARADKRVRVIDHRINRGLGAARNTGLAVARGKYVTFPDSDDVIAPNAYGRLVASLERSGSDFATGAAEEFGGPTRKRYWTTQGIEFVRGFEHTTLAANPGLIADHTAWTKVFVRSFLTAHDLRWPEDTKCEDVVHSVRAYCQARSVDVLPETVYFYRRRPGSITTALGSTKTLSDWLNQTLIALRLLKDAGIPAASAAYASKVLGVELVSRIPAFANVDAAISGSAATLVRTLLEDVPARLLSGLSAETRWELALLALGLPHALQYVRNEPSAQTIAGGISGLGEYDLPSKLTDLLGLSSETLDAAFRSRFVPHTLGLGPVEQAPLVDEGAPDVSVIIPTHNVAEWVDECLRTIRSAVDVRLEFVVVDDGSTDGTWKIIKEHERQDPRVRAFQSPGQGGGQARNYGVEMARGRYLAFCDGDDLVPPRAYAAMLAAAEATTADVVTGNFLRFYSNTSWNPGNKYGYSMTMAEVSLSSYPQLVRNRTCWNRLFRGDFWRDNGIAFPSVPRTNDIVPVISALSAASTITVVPDVTYIYRARPGTGSMTSRLGSSASIVSYLSEEATCAHLIREMGFPQVEREYWSTVLGQDCWPNLLVFLRNLDGMADRAYSTAVSQHLTRLLALAPIERLRELNPEQQAVYALVAQGDYEVAATLGAALESPGAADVPTWLSLIEAAASTPWLDSATLSRLAWKHVVRGLMRSPATVSSETAGSAVRLVQQLEASHGAVLQTVPVGREHRVANVLRSGSGADLMDLLGSNSSKVVARADELRIGMGRARIGGRMAGEVTSGALVVASRKIDGKRVYIPLGHAVWTDEGSGWEAILRPDAVLKPGRWLLGLESQDKWGLRRVPLIVDPRGVRSTAGRLGRFGAVKSSSSSTSIIIRGSLATRARYWLAYLKRRIGAPAKAVGAR